MRSSAAAMSEHRAEYEYGKPSKRPSKTPSDPVLNNKYGGVNSSSGFNKPVDTTEQYETPLQFDRGSV